MRTSLEKYVAAGFASVESSAMADLKHLSPDWPVISARLDEALALAPDARDTWLAGLDDSQAIKDTLRQLLCDPALADTLIERGALWNSGIFVWRAKVVLAELEQHTRELTAGLPMLASGDLEQFAANVTSISIDRGLLERSKKVVVLVAEFGWDDVGTWASLRRVRELDDTGNGIMGNAHCIDASGNVIHADGQCIVAYGISGMLVVSLDGLTFVTTLERASELGPLLNALPGSVRSNPGRA